MYYRKIETQNLYGHSGGEQGSTTDMVLDIKQALAQLCSLTQVQQI